MTKIPQLTDSIKSKHIDSTTEINNVAAYHLEDLRKSGLSDNTIVAAKIRSIPPGDIEKFIGYDIPEVVSAYEFPFGGNFSRIKVFYHPSSNTADKSKKLRKYHQRKGHGNRLYIPLTLNRDVLRDPRKRLYIVEGEKKTLCAIQNGLAAIGITGLWNWKIKGSDELIPDFDSIDFDGREVYFVPDSDYRDKTKNLQQAVERLARALQLKGASVYVVNLPPSEEGKTGLDDFIVKNGLEKFKKVKPVKMDLASCFRIEKNKLHYYDIEVIKLRDEDGKMTGEEEVRYKKPVVIASAIQVLAYTRNGDQENWGRMIQWEDKDNHIHKWAVPMEYFSGDAEAVRHYLLSHGCYIHPTSKYRSLLNIYLQTTAPDKNRKARCTDRTGWHTRSFIMPTFRIGDDSEELIYQGQYDAVTSFSGTTQGWQDTIGKWCLNNSRLTIAVCAALTGPLLCLCNKENGGLHFRGASSIGKTTILLAGCSVYGGHDYKQQWRTTVNGLEGIASAHNDLLLVLDELSESNGRDAGATAYMLANGQGKGRANRNGDACKRKQWRLMFLSSGEISLADHVRAEGKKVKAGQEVRMVDIPADTGMYGIFEDLHDHVDGAAFSRSIKEATAQHHGHIGVEFIRKLAESQSEVDDIVKHIIDEFVSAIDKTADGQVLRVASRFAIIAAAGELATDFGLTGWPKGWAMKGSAICFQDWVESRGGVMPHEEREILSQVRRFFENHGMSRFASWEAPEAFISNRAGFRRKSMNNDDSYEYYVLPETFRQEVCVGLDTSAVIRLLKSQNSLIPGKDRDAGVIRLPGVGPTRCYHITTRIMEV